MKKLALLIFLVIMPLFHPSLFWAEEAMGPKMILPEKVFDFKQVEKGDVIEHAFKVLNAGDQPLVIKKINPG